MAEQFDIQIGTREYCAREYYARLPFGLSDHDAFQHVWINGQTGTGKSALLLSMFAQIVRNGHGTTLIDLNGDLAQQALDYIPLSRRDDVINIDPTDDEHVLSVNPFHNIPYDKRYAVADDFVQACKGIWDDSWGERMEWILHNVTAAALHAPKSLRPTLLSIPLILNVPHYRQAVLRHVDDPEVIRFFKTEFDRYHPRDRSAYITPIENKIGKIIANPFVRNMLSPYEPAFQFREAISRRSILIIRLPKGVLGETAAKLIGSIAVSSILNAAMEQASTPEDDRIPHFLIADEKHNFPTSAFTSAYSEHRKYKLSLIVATQYTDQLSDEELKSMFGNIGTIIALRSSPTDAKRFYDQLGQFPASLYPELRLGEAFVRLLVDGSPFPPFRANTTIDHVKPANRAQQIILYNRQRYTRPRHQVESGYQRWLRKTLIDPEELRQQRQDTIKRKQQTKRVVHSHVPQPDPGTISERGERAKAKIRKLVAKTKAKHPPNKIVYPVFKKPTRRRRRCSRS